MDEIPQPLDPLLVSTGHKHELTCQKKSKNNMSCAKLRANNHPQICGLFDEVMCREIRFDHTGKLWRFTWLHPPKGRCISPTPIKSSQHVPVAYYPMVAINIYKNHEKSPQSPSPEPSHPHTSSCSWAPHPPLARRDR